MTHDPRADAAAPLEERLAAYLDGELDAEQTRAIEELLASDPEVRRRLRAMERTWELLDELKTPPAADDRFTRTTLEMVAVAAREDVAKLRAAVPRRRWALAAGLGAALAAGFLAVALPGAWANRRLLQDLPVLEHLEEYRLIDSMEFLRALAEKPWFSAEEEASGGGTAPAAIKWPADLAGRRQMLDNLAPASKEQLLAASRRFDDLSSERRRRMRDLHEALENDPNGEHLRRVAGRYAEWVKTLPLFSRAELDESAPADRLAWIEKQWKDEQVREGVRRLWGRDFQALLRWMNEYVRRREDELLARLPEAERKRLAEGTESDRRRALLWEVWSGRGAPGPRNPPAISDEELASLRAALSAELQERLNQWSPNEQRRYIAGWARQTLGMRMARPPLSPVDDKELIVFFENLPPADRDRLLNLSGSEMQRQLQLWYRQRNRPSEGPNDFRPGDGKGRRFGPPGGPLGPGPLGEPMNFSPPDGPDEKHSSAVKESNR